MTIVGLSEFMFGFSFLYEQTQNNWGNLVAAPVLPSLQQEYDEGWDAHLPVNGTDFYYQFKLSDYLYRGNAKYIKDKTYNAPYYRLALHKNAKNRQHQRLRTLSQSSPDTYYVAPQFNRIDTFNAAFLQKQITQQSRVIPVADCEDIDDGDQHYITFQAGRAGWIQHSEKKEHWRSFTGEDLPNLYLGTHNSWRPITKDFAINLLDKTKSLVNRIVESEEEKDEPVVQPRLLDFDAGPADRNAVLRRTSDILSVVLGVTLVVVGARN